MTSSSRRGVGPVWPASAMLLALLALAPQAEFTTYRTFAFLPDGGAKLRSGDVPPRLRILADPLFHAHLQRAIEQALIKRGFTPADSRDDADILVGYQALVRDRADILPAVYGVGWRGRVYASRPGQVRWYKQGTLVIDLIDSGNGHMIWRGVGVGAMRDLKPGADLHGAVNEIFGDFPPE
jgi:hypothetical protein